MRAGLAQPRAAQDQQRQRPAPGRVGPGPCSRPHSACDGRSACWIQSAAGRGERSRLRAAGARPEKAGGSGASERPTALGGRPLRLLTPTSPFPPRAPVLLLGPSMTHRSPRVPPSLFHFPLRNVTLPPPRLPVSSPLDSLQGVWGERAKGVGRRVCVTEFPITHSFGLFPAARQLRLPPSNRRGLAPWEVAEVGKSQSSSWAWVPASQCERDIFISPLSEATRISSSGKTWPFPHIWT